MLVYINSAAILIKNDVNAVLVYFCQFRKIDVQYIENYRRTYSSLNIYAQYTSMIFSFPINTTALDQQMYLV